MKKKIFSLVVSFICFLFPGCGGGTPTPDSGGGSDSNPNRSPSTMKLVFIHHSVGEAWLSPDSGNLRQALNNNRYYVTDSNYGWGPEDLDAGDASTIGDHTDIGNWYNWFLGPHRETYMPALYANTQLTDGVGPNTVSDPGGANKIVMFKSCFPNGQSLSGNPDDPPLPAGQANPIWGQATGDETIYTVANVKGLYRDLLVYFAQHPEKLFLLITTPPSGTRSVDAQMAARLRGINTWLVNHWLENYSLNNVAAYDYSNVLTANGHHWYKNGGVQYIVGDSDFLAYPTSSTDDHPSPAGQQKATGEFLSVLNYFVNRWQGN
jgi:hypothetical protein